MAVLYIFAVAVITLFFVRNWWKSHQNGIRLPPGPWGVPLLGILPFLDPKAPYKTLSQYAK